MRTVIHDQKRCGWGRGHVPPSFGVSNLISVRRLIFVIDFVEFYTIIYWLCKGHDLRRSSKVDTSFI